MKVKVQPYVSTYGDLNWGIYIKRWWLPVWVRHDYWLDESKAILEAKLLVNPRITEIV